LQVELTYLEGRDIYSKAVLGGILEAKQSVWIATANLKDAQVEWKGRYVSILRPLEAMCDRGIEIKILHSGVPSGPFLRDLCKGSLIGHANFRMRRCERVHLKAIITDGTGLFVGSPNLTGAGMGEGDQQQEL
jgi:phosphatidylserine/phosphatidylglycerophosphate/cardiolipin synthase-like enzyme